MDRRQFLQSSAAAIAAGSWLPMASHAVAGNGKLLVLVYLKGGNDAYNTFIPYADPRYYAFRPHIAVARDQIIQLSEQLGLHPAMRPLLPMWESRELALLQGIGQQQVHDQHYRDVEMQFTGASPEQYLSEGWLTRAMAFDAGRRPLHALAFGDLDIRVTDPMGPFRGNRLRVVNIQHPSDWLTARDLGKTAHIASEPARASADQFVLANPAGFQARFGEDEFSQALLATAQLAAAGIAPPVVHVTLNADSGDQHHAFDTHWNQLDYHNLALTRLAGGLAAFRGAMRELGQWNDTLVVSYDEFGRSPRENTEKGTHHGWASVQMLAGGRVAGGLHGTPLDITNVHSIGGPQPVIDYRALYTTVIESWWGQSARGVFDRSFKPLSLLKT
ncbi:MAG: DUF1501 domain-containing protein [Betaproteobacteria bacterium]|nr:DUF1501 domain-containing protein [Betaproteobacteria bacterium]